MRIAYFLADNGIPVFSNKGASIHVRELAQALCDEGHEVAIFCAKHGEPPATSDFEIYKTPASLMPSVEPVDADSVSSRHIKETRYLASAETLLAHFLKIHAAEPFDVIYERYSLWSAAGVRAGKLAGLPVLVEVNAPLLLEQSQYRQLVRAEDAAAIEREAFTQADALLTVSKEVAQYAISKGANKHRVSVIANAVNKSLFHSQVPAKDISNARGRFVLAFSGSLKQWHGVDILLQAFRELNRRLAGAHLLIIGDGPMREWCQGFASGADLSNKITFTDWCAHEEIPALLSRADVCIAPYPKVENFYFSPLKLFEYLAIGKATIASDIGQISDLLVHGDNGLLVPPGDIMALADAMETLYTDRELRLQLAARAAETAQAYTWQENARKVVQICRDQMRTPSLERTLP